MFQNIINYIIQSWVSISVQVFLTFLTYILIRYKYRHTENLLYLNKKTFKKLIEIFQSEPIIDKVAVPYKFAEVKANFSNFDVFNLGRKYKHVIKDTIREYGVGTCGPRGFYGTLDIHLDLEEQLAKLFGKPRCILYSNYFTCVQSVVATFCKSLNNVFVDRRASEAIRRGLALTRCKVIEYDGLEDLESKFENLGDKYVICERLGKNTGKLLDLNKLIELKNKYKFRIILDESYSIPFMYQSIENKVESSTEWEEADIIEEANDRKNMQRYVDNNTQNLYNSIDLIIGSLSHGYPTNGGFCVGCKEAIDYQRLTGSSYVFSASLPAFLIKAASCMLKERIDYSKIRGKILQAHKLISGILTPRESPILLVKTEDCDGKIAKLREEGYVVGRNGEFIRLCVNEETKEKDLERIGRILNTN